MRIEPLGDRAFILRDLHAPAFLIANWLNLTKPAGVVEAVASYDTVGIYTSGDFDTATLEFPKEFAATEPQNHQIPVCYEMGEDLFETSVRLGLTVDQLVEAHCSQLYTCYAVGFCPGFAYLGYLPEALQGVPRKPSPRIRVEPGSVGITGKQTGVYPLARPGGWTIIGRTPLTLVDLADEYFPIQAGDTIQFFPIGTEEFDARLGERL